MSLFIAVLASLNYWYLLKTWYFIISVCTLPAFSALTLLLGLQEGIRPVKTEWWGAGVIICLERGADLHMAQLMPLPLTVPCFTKIQIGVTFLVPAHPGSPGKMAVKWVCVCVCVSVCSLRMDGVLVHLEEYLNLARRHCCHLQVCTHERFVIWKFCWHAA